MTELSWLQQWYAAQCDGDWEHHHGVKIQTVDNPGWEVRVHLQGTPHLTVPLPELTREGEKDWIVCRVREGVFEGYGGPENLEEIVSTFRSWIEQTATDMSGRP